MTDQTTAPTVTPDPDRDGVILHLPEITYLDTQTWAVDVGLTTEGLAALRTLLAVLPAPVDRAAVLREAANHLDNSERLRDLTDDHMLDINAAANELRRVADETAATATQARRGDQFEAWLKQQRDSFGWQGANDRRLFDTLDGILDRYRLHADTGTPLGEHLCEGRVVGDCECLEQPAAGARQDGPQPARAHCVCGDPIELRDSTNPSSWIHSPGTDAPCLSARPDAGTRRRLADPELYTPRQDGAQPS